jgi:tRNA(adenine34) deaminase
LDSEGLETLQNISAPDPQKFDYFMEQALSLAKQAYDCGEIPVGAIVVKNDQIIASAYNQKEAQQCCVYHAEILAIQAASKHLNNFRLSDCDLYVTLEPCLMCAGAIYQARLRSVIFGASDPKGGALGSLYQVHEDKRLNHRFPVYSGVQSLVSQGLLQSFFKERREFLALQKT